MYSKLVVLIQDRSTLNAKIDDITAIVQNRQLALDIAATSNVLVGVKLSEEDMMPICALANNIISMDEYKKQLNEYITEKMQITAPNLTSLVGAQAGAQLISNAGSLKNLAQGKDISLDE